MHTFGQERTLCHEFKFVRLRTSYGHHQLNIATASDREDGH